MARPLNVLDSTGAASRRRAPECGANRRRSMGFTLIELMIVVAIVALLAAIAYPAYTDSVVKGKRGQGRTVLMDLLQQQERYLSQSGSYMSFAAGGTGTNGTIRSASADVGGQTIPFKSISGDDASSPAYLLGAEACPGGLLLNECVRVFAQPTFVDAAVGTLQIQSTGLKSCTGSNSAKCWN
jgi:type IV pilus assembly protein PilE